MIRIVIKLLVVLVVLVAVAIGVALWSIDSLARRAVEKAGTHVLGVATTLDRMSIGVVSPGASMHALTVANPPGFSDPTFLSLGEGALALDITSLRTDVVRIPSIRLTDLRVNLEQKGGEGNARTILAHMKSVLASRSGGSGGTGGSGGESGGRRYVIDELLIEQVHITAKGSGLPILQPTLELKVPKIRLESLGSGGKDPVGMDQLTAIVVNAVMQAAIEAGGSQLPKQMVDGVLGGLAGLGGGANDFSISIDTGGGLKRVEGVAKLAQRLGVDLGPLSERFGGAGGTDTGGGDPLEGAGKAAGEALKKGMDELFKKK